MPLDGPSKLIPTMNDFIAHWALVERAGSAWRMLTVLDGIGREGLIALREALGVPPADVLAAGGDERLATGTVKERRAGMRAAMLWFNMAVRAEFPGTRWVRLLEWVPNPGIGFDGFVPPLRTTLFLWKALERVQGSPFILQRLPGPPYTSADFAAGCAALDAAYEALRDAGTDLALARAEWDILQERAVAVMKAYGHMVKGTLGDGARLTASLPQLWPGPRRGERRGKAGRTSKAAGEDSAPAMSPGDA